MRVKTVMIIDHDPDFLTLLSYALSAEGFEVMTAQGGVAAMRQLRNWKPDFIFVNMLLPRLGGHECCLSIKNDPRFKKIPLIILTGTSLTGMDWELLEEIHPQGCVTKPLELRELLLRN